MDNNLEQLKEAYDIIKNHKSFISVIKSPILLMAFLVIQRLLWQLPIATQHPNYDIIILYVSWLTCIGTFVCACSIIKKYVREYEYKAVLAYCEKYYNTENFLPLLEKDLGLKLTEDEINGVELPKTPDSEIVKEEFR